MQLFASNLAEVTVYLPQQQQKNNKANTFTSPQHTNTDLYDLIMYFKIYQWLYAWKSKEAIL